MSRRPYETKARREQSSAIVLHSCNGSQGVAVQPTSRRMGRTSGWWEPIGSWAPRPANSGVRSPRWTVSRGDAEALPRNGFRLMVGWGVTDGHGHNHPDACLVSGAASDEPW